MFGLNYSKLLQRPVFYKRAIALFSAINLASVFMWNDYYFGNKPGNIAVISAFFILPLILPFSSGGVGKRYWLWGYGVLTFLYPLIVHFVFASKSQLSWVFFTYTILSAVFLKVSLRRKRDIGIIFLFVAALYYSFSLFPVFYLNILAVIVFLALFLLTKGQSIVKWVSAGTVAIAGFLFAKAFFESQYFDLQAVVEEKIITQYERGGKQFTTTRVKEDVKVYREGQLISSTADVFMFYESFVHAAFQLYPESKEVLYIGNSEQALKEIEKYDDKKVTTVSSEEALPPKKYDIIFADDTTQNASFSYRKNLTFGGIIVLAAGNRDISPADCDGLVERSFQIMLPSVNEIRWKMLARDSLVFDPPELPAVPVATKWYTAEAYDLISGCEKCL